MQDLIGYDEIIEDSMRQVIYRSLKKIEKTGLPGSHYFVVAFLTNFPGVEMSKEIKEKYLEEMTIALQYQFHNLVVGPEHFEVTLVFAGKMEKLVIPYKSIISFSDPSMNFALRFNMNHDDFEEIGDLESSSLEQKPVANSKEKVKSNIDLSAKVVSLDAFRKSQNDNKKDD